MRRFDAGHLPLPLLLVALWGLSCIPAILGMSIGGRLGMSLLVVALTVVAFGAAIMVRLDVSHPWVWFGPIFNLYSVSSPVLVLAGVMPYAPEHLDALALSMMALAVFQIATLREIRRVGPVGRVSTRMAAGAKVLAGAAVALGIVHLVYLTTAGVTTKYERQLLASPLANLDSAFYLLITAVSFLALREGSFRPRWSSPAVLATIVLAAGALGISGERDVLFRVVLVGMILYAATRNSIPFWWLLFGVPLGLLAVTFSGFLKMSLITGAPVEMELYGGRDGLLVPLLGTELRTASENLVRLLQSVPQDSPFTWGRSFISDIQRALQPGFLLDRSEVENTAAWFVRTFHPDLYNQGGGVGYTLVGAGYINFGILGVLLLFSLIGLTIRTIDRWSRNSVYGLIVYANIVPIFLYAIRSDLSAPLSQSLKHVILPIVAIWLISEVMRPLTIRSSTLRYRSSRGVGGVGGGTVMHG